MLSLYQHSAHVEQKRECPQGTKATPDRGTMTQTSQQSATSSGDDVDAAVAGVAAESVKAGWGTSSSSSSVLEELSRMTNPERQGENKKKKRNKSSCIKIAENTKTKATTCSAAKL